MLHRFAIDSNTAEGWGYGQAAHGVNDFVRKLKAQIEAIHESGCFVGYCLTQLSDVYQEKNGLMMQDRTLKVHPNILKEII